jgi:hypothetical protein
MFSLRNLDWRPRSSEYRVRANQTQRAGFSEDLLANPISMGPEHELREGSTNVPPGRLSTGSRIIPSEPLHNAAFAASASTQSVIAQKDSGNWLLVTLESWAENKEFSSDDRVTKSSFS